MKKLVNANPESHQVRRLYIQYLAMFKRSQRRTLLQTSLRRWLGRGNSMMERLVPATTAVPPNGAFPASVFTDGNSSDEHEEEGCENPAVSCIDNVCSSGVYDRSLEEVEVGLLMQQLHLVTQSDVMDLCCDVIEARPPRKKVVSRILNRPTASCKVLKEFDSGYSELHLVLWRNLARLAMFLLTLRFLCIFIW
jgi:hypothetical protein